MSTVMPFLRRNALALFVLAYASSAAVLHFDRFADIFPMYIRQLVALSPEVVAERYHQWWCFTPVPIIDWDAPQFRAIVEPSSAS